MFREKLKLTKFGNLVCFATKWNSIFQRNFRNSGSESLIFLLISKYPNLAETDAKYYKNLA